MATVSRKKGSAYAPFFDKVPLTGARLLKEAQNIKACNRWQLDPAKPGMKGETNGGR